MMHLYKRSSKLGQPPGTLIYTGEKTYQSVRMHLMDYSSEQLVEADQPLLEDCLRCRDTETTSWFNVDGLNDSKLVDKIGQHFGLNNLLIEDILHTSQRPKIEELGTAIYVVTRMLSLHPESGKIQSEQVSFILTKNALISFQESPGDVFDTIRLRLRSKQGRVRSKGPDYLLYVLLDAIVDNYFLVLEQTGENIEEVESKLLEDASSELMAEIYDLKRELIYIRKCVWPVREVVGRLDRGESSLIDQSSQMYLRDLYDHCIQVGDTVETFRDMLSGVQDLYLTTLSNKSNEVMKVLTIIATLFIPLTFVAGIYGMNFENMPELHWKFGYPVVWLIMLGLIGGMLAWFRKKKWF